MSGQRHLFTQRDLDAEHRTTPRPRTYLNPVAENLGNPLDDGQPQPHALAIRCAADVQLVELKEDRL
ncbi:hypothetical protein D9M73_281520 [compost metagenome]